MKSITFGDLTKAGKDIAEALRAQRASIAVSESAAGGLSLWCKRIERNRCTKRTGV